MPQNFTRMPLIPVSWGEAFDKLTILKIKSERISSRSKQINIEREKNEIESVVGDLQNFPEGLKRLILQLQSVNAELWDMEEGKRNAERTQTFDENFIQLARQVYMKNDFRAAIKHDINILLGSTLVEEKSYSAY